MSESNLSKFTKQFFDFQYLFNEEKFELIMNNVLGVYIFQKPLFSIKLYTTVEDAKEFIGFLNTYFFCRLNPG